jgi:hypothetical protein
MLELRMVAAKIHAPFGVPLFCAGVSDTTFCCTLKLVVEVGLLE